MTGFREELNEFLQLRPYREITVDGARFQYILSGEAGKQAMVFFNGLNMQEAWIRYVKAFEADYRVLMMEYPVCYRSNLALVLITTVTLDSSYVEDIKKKLSLMPLMEGALRLTPYSLLKKRLLGQHNLAGY